MRKAAEITLLPLGEKVGAEHPDEGWGSVAAGYPETAPLPDAYPSSIACGDTFSRKGRRGFGAVA